jgi:hypothetical protein
MVPTDEAKITNHILLVVIWSDEVTVTEALDIVALLERIQAGLTWSCDIELTVSTNLTAGHLRRAPDSLNLDLCKRLAGLASLQFARISFGLRETHQPSRLEIAKPLDACLAT